MRASLLKIILITECIELCRALKNNNTMTALDLKSNYIGSGMYLLFLVHFNPNFFVSIPEGAIAIAGMLRVNKKIKRWIFL